MREDVFRWLRMRFGTQSVFEAGPVAGGRTDSGIRFADVEFPIELKHEFQHVDRKHIREDYLCQPSDYAVARGRVTFMLILDLRADNDQCELLGLNRSTYYTAATETEANLECMRVIDRQYLQTPFTEITNLTELIPAEVSGGSVFKARTGCEYP